MLSLVNDRHRTPSLHGEERPESPEIDVDSPEDLDSPHPQLSPKDIKEEEEEEDEEDEKPNMFLPAPSLFAPLALHLQRPSLSLPIFQPFLPLAPALLRRNLPFSIDAILRPEFGQRLSPPTSVSPPTTSLGVSPGRSPPSPASPPISRSRSPGEVTSNKPTQDADCPPG